MEVTTQPLLVRQPLLNSIEPTFHAFVDHTLVNAREESLFRHKSKRAGVRQDNIHLPMKHIEFFLDLKQALRADLFVGKPIVPVHQSPFLVHAVCAAYGYNGFFLHSVEFSVFGEKDIRTGLLQIYHAAEACYRDTAGERFRLPVMIAAQAQQCQGQTGCGIFVGKIPVVIIIVQTGIAENNQRISEGYGLMTEKGAESSVTSVGIAGNEEHSQLLRGVRRWEITKRFSMSRLSFCRKK